MFNSTIRTFYFASHLPRVVADSLNMESGRVYTKVLVEHYRIYRKRGVWLSQYGAMRLNDFDNKQYPSLLHSHSVDAAQEGFYKAIKTAKATKRRDMTAKYPHWIKRFRTTVWKQSAIRKNGNQIVLSLARGLEPIYVELPLNLQAFPQESFVEMRLVYNKASRYYEWHLVVDDRIEVQPTSNANVAAIDLGEIHPVTITDGVEAKIISCRQLRAQNQHTNHTLAKMQAKQSRHQKGSRRSKRLVRRKVRFLAKQERRKRDLEHKISRAAVDWCVEQKVGTLAIGDVRDIADGKRLNKKSQQKISNWSHGKIRTYIGYKAAAKGISVHDKVDEAYTSQTCANCGNRHKPKGRVYACPSCGAIVHRDVQGAANILSRFLYGELAKVPVPTEPKYRHPVLRGKRSSPGHGASSSCKRETAWINPQQSVTT